jgi:signal transduction histidine kinase
VTVRCQGNAFVDGDPLLVRQAVTNLLANALEHTPQGGSIAIEVQTLPDRSVEISVIDTGVGIESERLPRVFDRFYRIDRTHDRYPRGTGLGLAIVKSIVDLHAGTIRIESVLGQGTTVRVTLPAGAAAQEV